MGTNCLRGRLAIGFIGYARLARRSSGSARSLGPPVGGFNGDPQGPQSAQGAPRLHWDVGRNRKKAQGASRLAKPKFPAAPGCQQREQEGRQTAEEERSSRGLRFITKKIIKEKRGGVGRTDDGADPLALLRCNNCRLEVYRRFL